MASNLTPLGIIDVRNEHSGDESDEDDDDVVEQSPCGRWEKRRQEVSLDFKTPMACTSCERVFNAYCIIINQ